MLYVTTRSSGEAYPALRTLVQDRGPDGGLFIPQQLPSLPRADGLGACTAALLNSLFLPRLTGAKVDFVIGKAPIRLTTMSHRIAVAECWHNPQWNLDWAAMELLRRIYPDGQLKSGSEWGMLAVRMSMLWGILQQLQAEGLVDAEHPVDLAVKTGAFGWPMAAVYLRKMGAPIGTVICASLDSSAVWDLVHRGELRTRDPETAGKNGAVYAGLERLVCQCLGREEANRYSEVCRRQGIYSLNPEQLSRLQKGLTAAVVGTDRIQQIIASVYRTNGYILSPGAALAYAGLQDYRASEAEGRLSLVMMEQSPACQQNVVAAALHMTAEELRARLDLDEGGIDGFIYDR